jgi:hypothetical protein
MARELDAALTGEPWAVGAVVHSLGDVLDDEGRPVMERRAPSATKRGVPMQLRACPYADARNGIAMNVSALAQVTRHLDAVLADVARYRAGATAREPSWEEVLAAVIDQLAGPAVFLLRARSTRGPVPARLAVGHKLAAGFFGALRGLLRARALGDRRPVTADAFLDWVASSGALIGASEACAGPPNLIARATAVFVRRGDAAPLADPARCVVAERLRMQTQVGLAWEMLDLAAECALLVGTSFAEIARPRNDFFSQKIARRTAELEGVEARSLAAGARAALPTDFSCACGPEAVLDGSAHAVERLDEMIARAEGAVVVERGDDRRMLARRFADYLAQYAAFTSASYRLEIEIRRAICVDLPGPVKSALPHPRALEWFEAIAGCRVECSDALAPSMVLANHHRRVSLA